jgi:hypothetical protein
MIKLYEEYTEDVKKRMESLEKIKELSTEIIRFYKSVFPDNDCDIWKVNMNKIDISFYGEDHLNNTDYICKCQLDLAESMNNRNNFYVNIQFDWNLFLDKKDKDKFVAFYSYLRKKISQGGFNSVAIEDIDSLISELNIDDYNFYLDTNKYNL